MIAPQDSFDRLRLIRSARVGPITYRQLVNRFGSASAALEALPQLAARSGGKPIEIAKADDIKREMEAVAQLGARYLFLGDLAYPALLAETETAPPALIARGNEMSLAKPIIAMVGARNASAAACRFARDLAFALADQGMVVVSGLARGIDTAAHKGALGGGTIGVIASGINISYPPENADLQEAIATQGLLIAEQPPGTEPLARHFPYRNRIIAGMAIGTIVVEAAPKSGSLITARLAAEAGREVMAVPGSPLDPRAQGCNQLIREGATLVQNADDVREAISSIGGTGFRSPAMQFVGPELEGEPNKQERQTVLSLLGPTPVQIDEIVRQSGLSPGIVQMVLLECELGGRLERHAGGRVSLG